MPLTGLFLFIFLLVVIGYKYYRLQEHKRKLYWLKTIPGWPLIGNVLEIGSLTDAIFNISRILNTHGKLLLMDFAMTPVILTNDYEFLEFLLGTNHVLEKSDDYKYLHGWLGTGLLTSTGNKWKSRRKLLTPAFHYSILKDFVNIFESNAEILVGKLEKEIGNDGVDIYPYINLFTLDVIYESAMGLTANAQIEENNSYVKDVRRMCRIVIDRSSSVLKRYDLLYYFSLDHLIEKNTVKSLHNVTNSIISKRKRELSSDETTVINYNVTTLRNNLQPKQHVNFIDILLKYTNENGENLEIDEIREEVDTIMFEGHDTTTSAISFTMFLLAQHPDIQEKVVVEQKQIFGDDINRKCNYEILQSMTYLDRVVKESLRMYPPISLFGRKTTADINYKGKIIPSNTNIVVYSYGVLHDPQHFPDPETFNPDRYENSESKRPYSFIPFSAGSRNCIGQKFAMLEIKSTISKVIRHFEIKPAKPEHEMIIIPETVLKSQNGVMIKLEKRQW